MAEVFRKITRCGGGKVTKMGHTSLNQVGHFQRKLQKAAVMACGIALAGGQLPRRPADESDAGSIRIVFLCFLVVGE